MIDVYFLISALMTYAAAGSPADSLAARGAAGDGSVMVLADSSALAPPPVPIDSSALMYSDRWHPSSMYDFLDPNIPIDYLISSALEELDIPEDEFNDSPIAPVTYPVPDEAKKLHAYMTALAGSFDRRIRYALNGIEDMPSRLLAMKYYLRRQEDINSSWVWTGRKVAEYKRSLAYRKALAEIREIQETFAENNPGYTLRVDTEVRSLADQVYIWNSAPSVDVSGRALVKGAIEMLADTTLREQPEGDDLALFRAFLLKASVPAVPTAAVPGFSQHGQSRAFDFIIWAGDTAIAAGADVGSARVVWDNSGWTEKLNIAITEVSSSFEGPLMSPHEPWHYSYMEE